MTVFPERYWILDSFSNILIKLCIFYCNFLSSFQKFWAWQTIVTHLWRHSTNLTSEYNGFVSIQFYQARKLIHFSANFKARQIISCAETWFNVKNIQTQWWSYLWCITFSFVHYTKKREIWLRQHFRNRYILNQSRSALKDKVTTSILLPPTYEVRGKVMFSLYLFTREGAEEGVLLASDPRSLCGGRGTPSPITGPVQSPVPGLAKG